MSPGEPPMPSTSPRSMKWEFHHLKKLFVLNNECCVAGDEILAVNGTPLQGMTHSEAITVFKNIKTGEVLLHVGRRDPQTRRYIYIYLLITSPSFSLQALRLPVECLGLLTSSRHFYLCCAIDFQLKIPISLRSSSSHQFLGLPLGLVPCGFQFKISCGNFPFGILMVVLTIVVFWIWWS